MPGERDILAELLGGVGGLRRLRRARDRAPADAPELAGLAQALLSARGEASGVALAVGLLARWEALPPEGRAEWFLRLARDFGPDSARLAAAVAAWQADPGGASASALHFAAEPRRQELFRRLNLAPGGTAQLVAMRDDLLGLIRARPELAAELRAVDADMAHLFASWFNRGFLELRRIDWHSPADLLEKIIRYEAVHAIRGWDDLRGRLEPSDRRLYAFFHPRMPDEPLIFVEVALTRGLPDRIQPLIAPERTPIDPGRADSAVFYSISNTQGGLRGVAFGAFLIKQVAEEIGRDLPRIATFATLSPLPGFAAWLAAERAAGRIADPAEAEAFLALDGGPPPGAEAARRLEAALARQAARYLLTGRGRDGLALDPVARFHLSNGAEIARINPGGDPSPRGLDRSHGVMVNYRYDLGRIERNHERYVGAGEIAAAPEVRRLVAPGGLRALLPRGEGGGRR